MVCASRQPFAGWPQYPGQGWTRGPPATCLDSLMAGVNPPLISGLRDDPWWGQTTRMLNWAALPPPATAASDIGTACPALLLAQGVPAARRRLEPPARGRLWAHMPEQQEGTEAKQQAWSNRARE